MKKRKKSVLLFLISLIISSCASFKKQSFRDRLQKLEKKQLKELNGTYSFRSTNDTIQNHKNINVYSILFNKPLKKIDSSNVDYFTLHIKNATRLQIELYSKNEKVKDTFLTGKYRKGMFYLNNTYLKCHGIPFLFGGCRHNKRRIGITKQGSLLVNEAVSNEGALLFLIGSGYSYNSVYEFKRVH